MLHGSCGAQGEERESRMKKKGEIYKKLGMIE
jgi:hypothetical protein